jgi:hypothetical protein
MPVFSSIRAVSHALGGARGVIRRLGGLCLVVMGVHAAADVLDDMARDAIDAVDLVVDETVAGLLGWLAAHGGMTPDGALAAIERFATAIDLAEKDWLAVRLALVVEFLLDVALLDLAWGTRPAEGDGLVDDLRASTRQLRASLSAVDLERLLAPVTLLTFAVAGGVLAGLALEQPVGAALAAAAPGLLLAGNVAAGVALVVVAVLVWRFGPDLVHGAIVRAHERGEKARERLRDRRAAHPPRLPGVAAAVDLARHGLRGAWLVLALFIAVTGLVGGAERTRGQGVVALIERLGATP